MLMDNDYLLPSAWARRLYHDHAASLPAALCRSPFSAKDVFEDGSLQNLARAWGLGDLACEMDAARVMRASGMVETDAAATGASGTVDVVADAGASGLEPGASAAVADAGPLDDAVGRARFLAFAACVERAVGSSVFRRAQLELERGLGVELALCPQNAVEIWERSRELLATPGLHVRGLLRRLGVSCLCTSDDATSDLAWHLRLAAHPDLFGPRVLPSFLVGPLLDVEGTGFAAWCERLGAVSGVEVRGWRTLCEAVAQRIGFFHGAGCRLADFGPARPAFGGFRHKRVAKAVDRALAGRLPEADDALAYRAAMTHFVLEEFDRLGWATIARGAVSGVGAREAIAATVPLGARLAGSPLVWPSPDLLGDPRSHEGRRALVWCADGPVSGVRVQLSSLAEAGLLGCLFGVAAPRASSHDLLGLVAHDDYRRELCALLGSLVGQGAVPADEGLLGALVEGACYGNARDQLGLGGL